MGVQNLWRVLDKGGAVVKLKGEVHFQQITAAVEHKVVAVDLSGWLMQAQTQPALLANYHSDYARAAKVVFDRTIHWLRHGCLPVFVIEGQTPQAKLDKLKQRCIQQYGPQRSFGVGNRAGGQFDRIGQAVKKLLEAFGVPCVQAVGEGEAMCAALNVCGWAHACHTLDVDALLFGAITVYRQMHLLTDKTKEAELTICSREDVQRVLGISRGGDAALIAVAQLAGGDYDLTGVENVGEALALSAVRHLLRDCESDDTVIQKLEAALTAGPNAELDALTKCTGCKACGHEGGTKSRIKQHPAQRGCASCGCTNGCIPRDFDACECEFHRRADDRLLNRVVKLAGQTPGFIKKCRLAADTYREQQQLAITAVQREYGVALPDSKHSVFRWMHRPDVQAIADVMCRYIRDWEYHQVRLKLLPLLLEWDVRQGPLLSPSAGVQFRPTSIRQVSTRGAEDTKDLPRRQQQGWRYIINVERLPSSSPQQQSDDQAAGDLAIDQAWLDGTARSRPKAQTLTGASGLGSTADAHGGEDCDEDYMYSQGQFTGTQATQQGFNSYTEGMSSSQAAAAGSGGGAGGGKSGSYQFGEHRSVRCSLMDSVWPELTHSFRNPPAASGRAKKSGGGRKKAVAERDVHQRTVKDFFGTTKDPYNAAKPWTKPDRKLPTGQDGSIIPGLAGITGTHQAAAGPAAAAPGTGQPRSLAVAIAELAGNADPPGCAAGSELITGVVQQRKVGAQGGFMEWICSQESAGDAQQQAAAPAQQQPLSQQNQQQDLPIRTMQAQMQMQQSSAAVAAAQAMEIAKGTSRKGKSSPVKSAAASVHGRVRSAKQSKAIAGMPAGALDRFVSKQQQQQRQESAVEQSQQPAAAEVITQRQEEQQQQELDSVEAAADMCVSPEVLPLAARLARSRAGAAAGVGRQAAGHGPSAAGAAGGGGTVCGFSPMPPPAKKASTVREKERLCSPAASPQKLQDSQAGRSVTTISSSPRQQQLLVEQDEADDAWAAAPKELHTYFTTQYQALMDDVTGLSPQAPVETLAAAAAAAVPGHMPSMAASRLFAQSDEKKQEGISVIDLLDSPVPVSACVQRTTAAGSRKCPAACEVVDLT